MLACGPTSSMDKGHVSPFGPHRPAEARVVGCHLRKCCATPSRHPRSTEDRRKSILGRHPIDDSGLDSLDRLSSFDLFPTMGYLALARRGFESGAFNPRPHISWVPSWQHLRT